MIFFIRGPRQWKQKIFLESEKKEIIGNRIWFRYRQKLCFSKEAMKNVKNLRILYICQEYAFTCINFHDGSIEYLSNNLRWFSWNHYPWESLPAKFEPKKLVHLQLRFSSLRHLWTEKIVQTFFFLWLQFVSIISYKFNNILI